MAGKKRKQQTLQQQKPQHRLALDADEDSVVSKKIARHSKQHQKGDKMISSDLSSKILKESLNQQKEILHEDEEEAHMNLPPFSQVADSDSEEKSDDEGYNFDGFLESISPHDLGAEEIKEEDEAALAAFFGSDAGPQLTLADIIIKKIKEKDVQASSELGTCSVDTQVGKYQRRFNTLPLWNVGKKFFI